MRSSRWWLLSVTALLTLVLALPPVVAAAPPATWAWVVARQPTTASYTPAAKDQGNSSGGTNTVQRHSNGVYTVSMPGVVSEGDGNGGHVQVSALGGARYCTAIWWDASVVSVRIHCHTVGGSMADSAFTVMFLTHGSLSGTIAYVWANQQSTTDYTPDPIYQWPGTITIHRESAGAYVVSLPGFNATPIHLQVTGYGDAFCKVAGFSIYATGTLVSVVCPAGDSRFDLLYLSSVGPTGVGRPKAAYAFVQPLQSGAARFPAAWRYSSAGRTPTLRRSAIGQYVVTLPGMPKGGMALVTPVSSGNVSCYLSQIRKNAAPQKVGVKCARADGSAADSDFFLVYTK